MEPEKVQPRHIVIIGGGVIGCTTAYFLTRHPKFDPAVHRITLLEATAIASGASGKAGGLLGLWAYPPEIVPLSFRLHRELAEEHGGAERWGYRKVGCGSIRAVVKEEDIDNQERARKRRLSPPTSTSTSAPARTVAPAPAPASTAAPAASSATHAANGSTASTNGSESSELSSPCPSKNEGEQEAKEWEKLPKQNAAAANLLTESPLPTDLDWIDGSVVGHYETMGRPGFTETAQVHPFRFTTAIAALAQERGVDIRLGAKVTRIRNLKTEVDSVEYLERRTNTTKVLENVTDVVLAAGPWTGVLLPRTRVEGLRAHSVVWEADVGPYAVFTDIQLPTNYVPEHRQRLGQKRKHKGNVDPEIYARPGNEVYACGEPDSSIPLPATADKVQCDDAQCDDLVAYVGTVSPALAAAPVKTRQACYLPRHVRFGDERGPLVGRTSVPGLWVASGHTCWGIQNGPATGCLMAEMMLDGVARSAPAEKLDPRKFKV